MINKNLNLMKEFNVAVFESVQYKKELSDIGNHKYYYSKEYGSRIINFLKDKKVVSHETVKGSLRSSSSSARLCANYFYCDSTKSTFEFEKPLFNDVSNHPTKMDAVYGTVYYECKCQEIVNGEHELLRKSYYTKPTSKLFKEFGISNIEIKKHFNKNGKNDYDYCEFLLEDLGINYPGYYHDINFNIKQLICHLIAIANETDDLEQKTLQYIVFKPKKEIIEKSLALSKLYEELDKQFEAIVGSKKIQEFISSQKHNIKLDLKYIHIDSVPEHFGI